MTKLERLRKSALESTTFRGHQMEPFCRKYRHWWTSKCKVCGMSVTISDKLQPNEIDIHGEAVALTCVCEQCAPLEEILSERDY